VCPSHIISSCTSPPICTQYIIYQATSSALRYSILRNLFPPAFLLRISKGNPVKLSLDGTSDSERPASEPSTPSHASWPRSHLSPTGHGIAFTRFCFGGSRSTFAEFVDSPESATGFMRVNNCTDARPFTRDRLVLMLLACEEWNARTMYRVTRNCTVIYEVFCDGCRLQTIVASSATQRTFLHLDKTQKSSYFL
jgi:hypothetical protein